ncbi:flavin reductase [Hwanghaeella grinnelliae]|uniref:Flavin reductase n=1 Tax=Hwanghaeella grinnelliae TaxID=2500179 RepID=A0A3S3UL99_9PROT|nr:flavin reductase family protein [Hwanghaeella grinnelliae]RVU33912.1 flavin reductase [Hwanghaeella grinnelliae]
MGNENILDRDEFDAVALRSALGQFATGVTIVTTRDSDGSPIGLTANSFNSVSLDPPLILWSLARKSINLAAFEASDHFAINVLAADQRGLSDRFARPVEDRFASVDWLEGAGGVPVIEGTLASFECAAHRQFDGGDHVIFLGRVLRFRAMPAEHDKDPLVYYAGQYAKANRQTAA